MVPQAHADIPGSQLVLLPGCSHMAQAKWPDLTLCLARGWLADVEAALNG
jgi:pimeloyl-ACP methyl ester carboxylesterase